MLSNVRKFFKKGASSPSSKDRPSLFSASSEHSGSRGRGLSQDSPSGSRCSGKNITSNGDFGPYALTEHSGSNRYYGNEYSTASSAETGLDGSYSTDTKSHPSSPCHPNLKKLNGRPAPSQKVCDLLGATEVVIADWIAQSSPKGDDSNEYDESASSPDTTVVPWRQKSELPPSFEFARPLGKPLDGEQIWVDPCYSPQRQESEFSPPFPFGHANPFGDQNSTENGTGAACGVDSSVDSVESFAKATKSGPSHYPSGSSSPRRCNGSPRRCNGSPRPSIGSPRPSIGSPRPSIGSPRPSIGSPRPSIGSPRPSSDSPRLSNGSPRPSNGSPRPSNGYLSPRCPSSPRRSSHSPDRRPRCSSNGSRGEGMSWGSIGSASPKSACQPSPDGGSRTPHPLPAPPTLQQHIYGATGRVPSWTEASTNPGSPRDWPGQILVHREPSLTHSRLSPQMMSPLTSPPRSPLRRPQPAFPHGAWSPLPAPPLQFHSSLQSPPRSPTPAPRKFSKWKNIKQIGTGSFGTVHEAINLEDGSFFAVKVSHDEKIPAEIQKEIEVLSMLRHPNVVQYFGTAMEDGHLCIFLELMQNSLQSIIKVFHRFEESLISTYTRQILQGLAYLHRKNTIHRDIKCANILVDKDGQVKLADFGLAKEVGVSLATSCKGTPYFMAPEILKPHSNTKRGYGLPVDIWSLGCTVLEMADGKPPWSFLQGYSFFFKLNKGELPPIPPHLSHHCQDFIRSCLQFRPEDRPTAAQLLSHPFVANAPVTSEAAAFVASSAMCM